MKKIIVVVLLLGLLLTGCGNFGVKTGNYTNKELKDMIEAIYESVGKDNIPAYENIDVDIENAERLAYYTGLKQKDKIEYVVASDSLIGSMPYSFVMIKVKNDASVEQIKQEIYDNIDTRKWICVEAEALYINNYDTVITVIMTNKETADKLYQEFINYTKDNVGKKLEKEMEI